MATQAGKPITVTLVGGPAHGRTVEAHEGQPALATYDYAPDGAITAIHTYALDRTTGQYTYPEP